MTTSKSGAGRGSIAAPVSQVAAIEADGVAELSKRPVTLGVVLLVVGTLASLFAPVAVYLFDQQSKLAEQTRQALKAAESLKTEVEKLMPALDQLTEIRAGVEALTRALPPPDTRVVPRSAAENKAALARPAHSVSSE